MCDALAALGNAWLERVPGTLDKILAHRETCPQCLAEAEQAARFHADWVAAHPPEPSDLAWCWIQGDLADKMPDFIPAIEEMTADDQETALLPA